MAILAQIIARQKALPLSKQLSADLAKLVPGGVNSPFRSFEEVGGHTVFFNRAQGSKIYDIDGNSYIDYLGAWGPAILGHCHPDVISACQEALALGPVFGAPHQLELEFARALTDAVENLEQVRFVNSGTEAVMSAVRLARGATGRDKVILFEGCYHGHSDATLATRQSSSSAGIPKETSVNSLLVEYNNLDALEQCFREHQDEIACVLIEPIAGSMNVVLPKPGYLQAIRKLCDQNGALLIFDEVLCGFRVALGGAQSIYGVNADLTCYGKALAGGMPIGAYGGSKSVMSHLLPLGKVYQAGTFSGNPVTMAGGVATIRLLSRPGIFEELERINIKLFGGLGQIIAALGLPVRIQRVGAMFGLLFADHEVTNFKESLAINSEAYARFFHYLLSRGVYLPPSSVDAACVSIAHSEEEVATTLEVCQAAFKEVF